MDNSFKLLDDTLRGIGIDTNGAAFPEHSCWWSTACNGMSCISTVLVDPTTIPDIDGCLREGGAGWDCGAIGALRLEFQRRAYAAPSKERKARIGSRRNQGNMKGKLLAVFVHKILGRRVGGHLLWRANWTRVCLRLLLSRSGVVPGAPDGECEYGPHSNYNGAHETHHC